MARGIVARGLAIALLGAGMIGASAVIGKTGAAAQMTEDVALTGDMVENFIKSYPEVKAASEGIAQKYNLDTGGEGAGAWAAWATATAAWGELDGVASSYGFDGFKQWLQVTMSIAKAYAFAEEGGGIDAGLAQAMEEIKTNPNIPEAQKKMLIEQMGGSMAAVGGMRPSQENIDAVAPYAGQLKALFE